MTGGDVYEQMGRFSARDQLAGVYRHLLEGGDEFSLPRRGLVLWQSQHDSGRLGMTIEGLDGADRCSWRCSWTPAPLRAPRQHG